MGRVFRDDRGFVAKGTSLRTSVCMSSCPYGIVSGDACVCGVGAG